MRHGEEEEGPGGRGHRQEDTGGVLPEDRRRGPGGLEVGVRPDFIVKAGLEAHLGYASNDKSPKEGADRRNGYTAKTVRTSAGEVSIDVPRDRDATFEPAVVPKGERDLSGIEGRVLSMYARGMSQRDIAATVREIYGFSMSAETVSAITDRIWEELERWRSRPLRPVYAFMFVD